MEQSLELYTCSTASRDSKMPEYARNGTIPRSYNELATLMSVTGKQSGCALVRGTFSQLDCCSDSEVTVEEMKNLI